ncbi:MAG: flagellar basal-body rod protein FlgF [Paracoccaceae bacterium]|jgi:flagellar basal-body rod protein FlgF
MDNAGYVTLTRQSGLLKEMQAVANNLANMSTTGFQREATLFAEVIERLPVEGGSLSMADARVRATQFSQGGMMRTGGSYDLAIEGPGFFQIDTPNGPRLTRDGAFLRNADGEMATADGNRVLDAGGAPIFLPPTAAKIEISSDGTVTADGAPVASIGLFTVADVGTLRREGGVMFIPEAGLLPVFDATVHQGFLEGSSVSPVSEITRMIEVQRAYEAGQALLEREDERIRGVVRTLGQPK